MFLITLHLFIYLAFLYQRCLKLTLFIFKTLAKSRVRLRNGTACFKNVNYCLNANIYSYLETSGGQSSNLYLNVAPFFNTDVK